MKKFFDNPERQRKEEIKKFEKRMDKKPEELDDGKNRKLIEFNIYFK